MGIPPYHGTLVPVESGFSSAQVELGHLYRGASRPRPYTLSLTQWFHDCFPSSSMSFPMLLPFSSGMYSAHALWPHCLLWEDPGATHQLPV